MGARDIRQRDSSLAPRFCHNDLLYPHLQQNALPYFAAFHWDPSLYVNLLADLSLEVTPLPQWAVEPRRAHLQHICRVDGIQLIERLPYDCRNSGA